MVRIPTEPASRSNAPSPERSCRNSRCSTITPTATLRQISEVRSLSESRVRWYASPPERTTQKAVWKWISGETNNVWMDAEMRPASSETSTIAAHTTHGRNTNRVRS